MISYYSDVKATEESQAVAQAAAEAEVSIDLKNDSNKDKVHSVSPIKQLVDHDTIVAQMVAATNQDKDVCTFYLESTNWDLKTAIELLRSMGGN